MKTENIYINKFKKIGDLLDALDEFISVHGNHLSEGREHAEKYFEYQEETDPIKYRFFWFEEKDRFYHLNEITAA